MIFETHESPAPYSGLIESIFHFKGFQPDHSIDRVVPGDEFSGKDFLTTRERLYSAATSKSKFAVADEWLDANFDRGLLPPQSLIDVVESLQAQPAAKFNEVIESFDGTQKHLISQFRKYIGITPKQYQRVLRFNDVFVQLQGDQFLSWSDIAYRCGYSDQSHFIREFKRFSGFIPESFLREEFDEDAPNFFPVDRNN